ncbi:MAG: zinc-binding alcohol dehydrogenase/oxidoreductase [Planctomycetota bacterium]|jgi:zinc-binding alcohol dehydrogenase/oxidoreductase
MKAVVLNEKGGPENLQIEEVDTPNPGPGELRVKLKASALNRRDYWITIGKYPGINFPCTAGSDGAGIIDAVGEGGDDSIISNEVVVYPAREWGDSEQKCGPKFRVLGMPDQGTFAEYICVPSTDVYAKPAHLSWEQAAAIPLAGLTSWRAVVTHAEVQAGQKFLITAAGSGVSTFAIQWALGHGAEVYVTSGSEEKINKAIAMGASGGANYKDEGFTDKLREMSGGFDAIIDSGGGDGINSLLDTLGNGGRYVFFGATLGNASAGLEMAKLFFRHVRIQGTMMGSPKEFAAMMNFVSDKKIEPIVHEVFPMSEATAAHKLMESFSQMGKIVLQNE